MTQRVQRILEALRTLYPEAHCELNFAGPYELLVATILSAQCTDKRVNLITPALFERFPNARRLAKATVADVEPLVQTCGLYRSKAKNLVAMARILADLHDGEVPSDRAALEALPGVGRKTANVVLSNAFDVPAIAVDTHVLRVSRRIGLAKGKTPEQVERELMTAIPERHWSEAHHLLIWHGRRLCRARGPLCEACPVAGDCAHDKAQRRAAPKGRRRAAGAASP